MTPVPARVIAFVLGAGFLDVNDYLELHENMGGTKFTDVQELNYSLREVELRMWMLLYSCTGVAKQQGHQMANCIMANTHRRGDSSA